MLVDSPNNKGWLTFRLHICVNFTIILLFSHVLLCYTGDYPSDIAKNHVLFQLISIANDRIKLENQLRELKKEKRRMTKGTSGSVGSRIGMISPTESRASSRGASRSTSGARAEPLRESSTAAESDDSDEDDDNFDHLSKTTEGTETSGSLSLQNHTLDKDKLFAKYRRHSFRVGYFDEEDKERAGTGRQGSEGPHSQLNCAT